MKIALLTTSFLPQVGGAEFVVHHLADHWSGLGHQVVVICEQASAPPPALNYPVNGFPVARGTYRFGPHRFPFRQYSARQIQARLDQFQPDLVSGHFGYPVGVWLSGLERYASRALVTCHGRDLTTAAWGYRRRYRCDRVMAAALNRVAGVVAISRHARRQLIEIGVAPGQIHEIRNGVDVERFSRPRPAVIRERFNIPAGATLVLSVGRHSADKAYLDGIDAVSRLRPKGKQICYLIVGAGVEEMNALAASVPGDVRIVLCPGLFDDDLVAAYQEADIYFSASVSELCPLTVLEAMAAGKPLVLTDISGHQDFVEPERNGLLAPAGDVAALSATLQRLIDDLELRESMSRANRSLVKAYSWDEVSSQYLELAGRTIDAICRHPGG